MSDTANVIIVGGGVVGCAIAAELAQKYQDVFLLERNSHFGGETSSRNSGVIHAGIYYKNDSLKSKLCIEGNRLTYELCEKLNVPHKRCGKVIVATEHSELEALDELLANAEFCGVEELEMLGKAELKKIEPNINGIYAIYSPNTGILDSVEYVKALACLAKERGAQMLTESDVIGVEKQENKLLNVRTMRGALETRVLINSAGLDADLVALLAGSKNYRILPCRGEYYEFAPAKSHLVNALVYPVPVKTGAGLGVHLTKTIGGTVLVGPNAKYLERKNDYEKDWESIERICVSASKLLPSITLDDLKPAYAGIRPKLVALGDKRFADFIIERDTVCKNIINLVGIESPGFTAAAAIAKHVAKMVNEDLV